MLYKLHKLKEHGKNESKHKRLPSAYLTTFGSNEIQKTLLARWNVSVIELDPVDKQKSIDEFLKSLV